MSKTAVVLFNLGGPDGPADVEPFLKNLFSDKAIIRAPAPVRFLLARLISKSRAASARDNYARMGGGSPLLGETRAQADALQADLVRRGLDARCFIAMRYWKPFAEEAVRQVKASGAERVILLPLYPQFSSTTTASSLKSWADAGGPPGVAVCCYPETESFILAHARKLIEAWEKGGRPGNVRCLLSAHGLPETVVRSGDPYQWQVELTVERLRPHLPADWEIEICYQSRVGPLKWIGPATEASIEKAAKAAKAILLSPIAFVSEHIETLVELDVEYRHLAEQHGASHYLRAAALGVDDGFIGALGDLVEAALREPDGAILSGCGGRICPGGWKNCPNQRPAVKR